MILKLLIEAKRKCLFEGTDESDSVGVSTCLCIYPEDVPGNLLSQALEIMN